MILIDIDLFKKINDTYRHPASDQVLIQIGNLLREEGREIDLAARYGGEEFVMLLPETNRTNAIVLAKRLQSLMENYRVHSGEDMIRFTASFGVAAWNTTKQMETFDQLIS